MKIENIYMYTLNQNQTNFNQNKNLIKTIIRNLYVLGY